MQIKLRKILNIITCKLMVKNKPESHLNWSKFNPNGFLESIQNHSARQFVFQKIKEEFRKRKITEILEVGFGSAFQYLLMRDYFAENAIKYTGVDYTSHFVKNAQRLYPEGTWIHGDVRNLKFSDKSFDLVFIYHVLEHQKGLYDVKLAIEELCRVSKNKILIIWFRRPTYSHATKSEKQDDGFFYYKYNVADIWNAITSTNFSVKQITSGQNSVWELEKDNLSKVQDGNIEEFIYKRISNDHSYKKISNILTFRAKDKTRFSTLEKFCLKGSIAFKELSSDITYIQNNDKQNTLRKPIKNDLFNFNFSDSSYDWVVFYVPSNVTKKNEINKILAKLCRVSRRKIMLIWNKSLFFCEQANEETLKDRNYAYSASYIWNKVMSKQYEIKQISFRENHIWEIERKDYSDYLLKNNLF